LKMVFALLELHTLVAKERKCVFGSSQVAYLRHNH
jgi:hypothetical protein